MGSRHSRRLHLQKLHASRALARHLGGLPMQPSGGPSNPLAHEGRAQRDQARPQRSLDGRCERRDAGVSSRHCPGRSNRPPYPSGLRMLQYPPPPLPGEWNHLTDLCLPYVASLLNALIVCMVRQLCNHTTSNYGMVRPHSGRRAYTECGGHAWPREESLRDFVCQSASMDPQVKPASWKPATENGP